MSLSLYLGFGREVIEEIRNGGARFYSEILVPSGHPIYFNANNILSKEEQQLIQPAYDNPGKSSIELVDPQSLKRVFERVYDHLKTGHEQYPLVHWLRTNSESYTGTSETFTLQGLEYYLDGFHNVFEHRDRLCLWVLDGKWKVENWLKATPLIEVGEMKFEIKTENKCEQFKDILEELIGICEQAIKKNEQVHWVFSN